MTSEEWRAGGSEDCRLVASGVGAGLPISSGQVALPGVPQGEGGNGGGSSTIKIGGLSAAATPPTTQGVQDIGVICNRADATRGFRPGHIA